MGKIIAVSNQKGGVGKSTTVVNLAAAMGGCGKKVLVVDIDAQGNTTTGFGVRKSAIENTVYEVMIGLCRAQDAVVPTAFKGVSLITSAQKLAGAEIELANVDNRLMRLKMELLTVKDKFDFILIDCPPSLELLTLNALAAADSVLIPVQCEYYALEGLSDLMTTMRMVKKRINPNLGIFAVVLTMFDGRTNFSVQVAQEVRRHFPGKVCVTAIPRNVRLAEAPSHGLPVIAYDRSSKGALAYRAVAEELKARL